MTQLLAESHGTTTGSSRSVVDRGSRRPAGGRLGLALVAAPLLAVVVVAIAGPWLAPHGVGETVAVPFSDPGPGLPLGADHLGRSVWSRLLHGGRPIVLVPVVATAVTTVVGGLLGIAIASLSRRRERWLLSALDVVIVLPPVLVLLLALYRFGASSAVLVLVVVVVTTPYVARFTKATARPLLGTGWVEHAVAAGEGRWSVLVREVVPNLMGPLLADAGLRFVGAVYLVASAGFLGFGPAPPASDWSSMIAQNIEGAGLNLWSVVAPAAAIAALTVPTNLLADRLLRRLAR